MGTDYSLAMCVCSLVPGRAVSPCGEGALAGNLPSDCKLIDGPQNLLEVGEHVSNPPSSTQIAKVGQRPGGVADIPQRCHAV
jgi:hypothetical protein